MQRQGSRQWVGPRVSILPSRGELGWPSALSWPGLDGHRPERIVLPVRAEMGEGSGSDAAISSFQTKKPKQQYLVPLKSGR